MAYSGSHADAQREYFDRKGLAFHGYGEISDSAKPPGGVASAGPSAPPTAVHGEVLLSVFIYHPIKVLTFYAGMFEILFFFQRNGEIRRYSCWAASS